MKTRFKKPRWESAVYLDYVREQPCMHCGHAPPSEAHHWSATEKGMGRKPSDVWAVPLCRICHAAWHTQGTLPRLTHYTSREAFKNEQRLLLADWVMGE